MSSASARRFVIVAAVTLGAAACGGTNPHPSRTAQPPSVGTQAISAIAAAGSQCGQFANGALTPIRQLTYTVSGNAVTSVTPAAFVYWVKVTTPTAGSAKFIIAATSQRTTVRPQTRGGDVFAESMIAGSVCRPVSNSVTFASGPATVQFNASAGTTYLLNIQFASQPYVGQAAAALGMVTISTTGVAGSSSSLGLVHG